MTLENYLAEAGALASLAGILAGFSLTAVVQFLTAGGNKGRLETAEIIIFSAASVMFLYSLIVAVLTFAAAAELNRIPIELENLNIVAFLILCAAIYVFLAGIGVAGWLRSKIAGALTTVFAIISMCMVSYALFAVLAVFG
ncbi:MAG: hypothetical protein DPW18_13555 [Chloroflexi bacterium]|nr:hypothetical protein [Chloroflexota bacterium]MDL1943410.1 hypothetical protein [Chloroflexi bacterium CFX2]